MKIFSRNHSSGVSLLIAIIFVSALMLIIAGLAETTYQAYKNIQSYQNLSRAETASESLLAQAKLLAEPHDAGWNDSFSWNSSQGLISGNFAYLSMINNLKDMLGACATPDQIDERGELLAPGGILPCGASSFRYDVIGRATQPLSFPDTPGPGAPSQYPALSGGDCTLATYPDPQHCYFVTPSPILLDKDSDGSLDTIEGTGTLVDHCLDLDNDGTVTNAEKLNGENPCHWGKLEFGKPLEIPLYYEDDTGSIVDPNAVGNALNVFRLRIRIPCRQADGTYDPNKWCDADDRPKLYPPSACDPDRVDQPIGIGNLPCPAVRTFEEDKQLVRWEIYEQNSSDPNQTYSLLAMDDPVETYGPEPRGGLSRRQKAPRVGDSTYNTELYASKITKEQFALGGNRGRDNVVLAETDIGLDVNRFFGTINNFLKGLSASKNIDKTNLAACPAESQNWSCRVAPTKPKLRLELIYRPRISTVDSLNTTSINLIPYLEYQILTDRPIGDEKKLIRAEATVSGITKTAKTKVYNKMIQQSFVLEN